MRDYSIFSGWKELHGKHGVFSFEDKGQIWNVFQHVRGEDKGRFYVGSIDKISKETNVSLYERGTDLVFPREV
jgi:hypothetical protein